MKKVLWLFAMLVTCMAANAADYYVVGFNNEWSFNDQTKFTDNGEGMYTLTGFYIGSCTYGYVISEDGFNNKWSTSTRITEDTLTATLTPGNDNNPWDETLTGTFDITLKFTGDSEATITFARSSAQATVTYGLRGQFTSESWDEFELTEGNEGIWSGTITPARTAGSFGLWEKTNGGQSAWYSATEAATLTETNTSITLVENGSANPTFNLTADKEYTFTFNVGTGELSVTFEGEPVEPGYPTTAAVIGQLNGSSDWDTTGTELTSADEGVFSGTVTLGEYFRIKLDGIEYGGETDGTVVEDGTPVKYVLSSNNAFKTTAGTYAVTINCEEQTVTLVASEDPEPAVPETLYLRGNINATGWTPSNAIAMTKSGDGLTFTVTSDITDGGQGVGYFSFSVANGTEEDDAANDWDTNVNSADRYGAAAGGESAALDAAMPLTKYAAGVNASSCASFSIVPGRYIFTISFSDNTPTVTISSDEDPIPPSDDVPEHFYMIGNVNGTEWSTSAPAEMTKDGNAFTLSATIDDAGDGFGYFSFCTATGADWDELNSAGDRFGAASENTPVSLTDNVFEEVLTHYVVNVDNSACQSYEAAAGKYTVTVTFSEGEATMRVVSEGSSGIADIDADNTAKAEYYNMQGVRVANPTAGLYIEVREGQVRKVLVK